MPTVVPGPKKSPNAPPGRRNWLMLVMSCVEVQAASVQIFKTFPSCAFGRRDRQQRDVRDVVRAGMVAVEEIKELSKRQNLPTLANLEGTSEALKRTSAWMFGVPRTSSKAFGCSVHRNTTGISWRL